MGVGAVAWLGAAVLAVAASTPAQAQSAVAPRSSDRAPALVAGDPDATTAVSPAVGRLTGSDRYAASVAASRAAFPTGTHPDVVYLVSGTSPWDSLSASPAAVRGGGGVLLTRGDGIPSSTAAELRRLAPASIVLVGPTTTLSSTVESQAASYAPAVTRVAGTSRYGTSRSLVRRAFEAGSVTRAWVTTGRVWTDGIAAGAAAAVNREPLLTVDGSAGSLPASTVTLLRDLGVTSVVVVGGTTAVSPGIESQLDGILGSSSVTRVAGADQYSLSARVSRLALPQPVPGPSYVASGREFASGLVGAFLAGRTKRPLLYTMPFCVPASVRPALAAPSVTRLTLLGGEVWVRGLVGSLEACRSIRSSSSAWVLVNKRNALRPTSYVPSGLQVPAVTYPNGERLRSDAGAALARMFSAARSEGAGRMSIASGYRSYSTQYTVYWNRVGTNGKAYADTWIARPGYSEHQSGLGLDIAPVGNATCNRHNCIGSTPQGAWLRDNAWRFGFVLRYESGSTGITGYHGEPWHFRYVGTALSTGYHNGGWHSLEQFLDEPAAPTY